MLYKIYRTVIIVFFILAVNKSFAQQFEPIFEDADGKTSIITPRGFFGLNTANSSIRFQYFYTKSASPDPKNASLRGRENRFYFGANVAGSATDGISNLFSDGNFNPGTSVDLFIGHRSLFFSPIVRNIRDREERREYTLGKRKVTINDWLTLRLGIQAAKYKLYDPLKPFNDQLSSEIFRGHLVQLAYTVLFNGRTSIGLSWDVSRVNNINSLTSVKFKQQTVNKDSSGQITRTIEQEINAYTGKFETSIVNTYSLDVVKNLISQSGTIYAFNLFGRLMKPDDYLIYKTGIGFYVFPKSKPGKRNPIFGGIFVESNDLTNKISNTTNFFKRIDLGFTVKFMLPSLGG